ncbi:MAG: Type secretion system protein subtype b [Deltaproteobacteria bacterium]|nr:Type secretion system protein subtype b [Deltaproteobacteria bacterium]
MKKNSRLYAIALPVVIVLAILVAYQYGYLAVKAELTSLKERETARIGTLERYVNLIAEKPSIEKRLESLREKRTAEMSQIINAQTMSLAAAALQDIVKSSITARGGSIASERVEKPDDLGKLKVINISIDAVVPDTRALSDVLFTLETHTPYLKVRELDARVKNFKDPRELMVKLRISALTGGK